VAFGHIALSKVPSDTRSVQRTLLVSTLLSLLLFGCSRATPAPPPASSARTELGVALPQRAEVVAEADALAVQGTQRGGVAGLELLRRAATLRERLFRLERKETDALEAIELYEAVTRLRSDDCAAALRRTLLEAELRSTPAKAYRDVYLVRARSTDPRCRESAERALLGLAAFRPLPSVLDELEHEARQTANAGTRTSVSARAPAPPALASGAVVVPSVKSAPSGPVRITSVERYGAKDAARVVVHVTHPSRFEVGELPASTSAPSRLIVDLENVTYTGARTLPMEGLVERVRVGAQKTGTRVVLDLSRAAYQRVFYLPEPFRLVIDVSKEPPFSARVAAGGKRSVRRVVLDPGHGGNDPGARGPSGLREKDVTLDIAHRAAPLLARELGISTLLTRDSDVYVPLDERTARANAFAADLLISIHCNASEDGAGHGVMTFVLDDSRDALAARVAARENSASAAAAAELANAMSRVIDRGTLSHSEELAFLLQRAAMASLSARYADVPDLGVRRAGFYVLAGAAMPAVLFESSFISSPLGEERLNSPDYREKLADAIVNGVRAYREGRSGSRLP
jgi:N-acetylmuramoyl-L-alanine amidase